MSVTTIAIIKIIIAVGTAALLNMVWASVISGVVVISFCGLLRYLASTPAQVARPQ